MSTSTIDLLNEIAEFLEDYVDVKDGEDGPQPNKAMSLKTAIDHEIEHLKRRGPSGEDVQRLLPSGWIAVPVKATVEMHNAAALGEVYFKPQLKMDDDGYMRIESYPPDWSWAWRLMVEAAPSLSATVQPVAAHKEQP